MDQVERVLERIEAAPTSFARAPESDLRAMLGRFPYWMVFAVLDNDDVLIVALAHARRRAGYWRQRVRVQRRALTQRRAIARVARQRYTQEVMPMTVRGHVRSGRLVVDVPTDLPEGTEVELVSIVDAVEVSPVESVIERAGELVGSLEGPGDLSTSPRHMAEYGR